MQETGVSSAEAPDSVYGEVYTEIDLALLDALQADPRAPWARIGPALGVDPTTAARRWERLSARGLAWITAYDTAKSATVAFVDVRCAPGTREQVSASLAELPWVFSVEHVAGEYDLFVSLAAADLAGLGRQVDRVIGPLPGVHATRASLAIRLYQEASGWQVRAMEPAHRALLSEGRSFRGTAYTASAPAQDPGRRDLLLALGADGRRSYAELAVATGTSEHTVRRRLRRMLREQEITLRCDFAHPPAGWAVAPTYRATVPHAELDTTGTALARLPQVRLCASVSGGCNLLVSFWLRDLGEIGGLDSLLAERFPALRVEDRTVTLRTAKRMGRLLDHRDRAVGRVPLVLPDVGT